jgi:hypothetical protein
MVGHPRRSVHLEEIGLARAIQHQVDAAPAAAAQSVEGVQRLVLDDALGIGRQSARDEIARVVRLVFRLVVVELSGRFQLDERQRLVCENSGGQLDAFDKGLRDHDAVVVGRERVGFGKLARVFHLGHADG